MAETAREDGRVRVERGKGEGGNGRLMVGKRPYTLPLAESADSCYSDLVD